MVRGYGLARERMMRSFHWLCFSFSPIGVLTVEPTTKSIFFPMRPHVEKEEEAVEFGREAWTLFFLPTDVVLARMSHRSFLQ